jgi:mannobiose 2-epimerase
MNMNNLSKENIEKELISNILPFWITFAPDHENGGFYGGLTDDHTIHNEIPRTAVTCARILWTFSHAYLIYKKEEYRAIADIAFDYLITAFWDNDYGGIYWSVDLHGNPILDRKHHYAQAFGIYGLSEYYRATKVRSSLDLAIKIFDLLEEYAYDPIYGGYIEGSSREWSLLSDMRLGDSDMNCQKSMNTMLHMMEAYANFIRVWDSQKLKDQLKKIIETFSAHIISESGHFLLFFDNNWKSLSNHISYGHDIEGSWLLFEAAERLGDPKLLKQAKTLAIKLADGVYVSGVDKGGGIIHEVSPQKIINPNKEWWPQAEAVVGFYNAYQLSEEPKFLEAAINSWDYIQNKFIDIKSGGWFTRLLADGSVDHSSLKIGPWECPYHESRMCFEMIDRLPR